MICGACERRVDPSRSFCTKCGGSVFIDERVDRPLSAAAAPEAPPTASSFFQSLQDAVKSAQESAKSFESRTTIDRATVARNARARAKAARKAAPSFSLGPLIRLAIFVGVVWYVGSWLLAIPEVIVLKERAQAGHFSDADLQAARDAIGERIQTFLRNAQDPNPPPRQPAPSERARVEGSPPAEDTRSAAPPPAPARERRADVPSSPPPPPERSAAGAVRPGALVLPPPEAAALPPGVSLPGDEVTLPRVLQQVPAAYTPEAMRAKVEGTVVLQAVVRTHGLATNIAVVQSLDERYGLDQQAIAAVRQWRFAPGQRMGQPVPVLVQIAIRFSLR